MAIVNSLTSIQPVLSNHRKDQSTEVQHKHHACTRTVVRECCNDEIKVNGELAISDPSPPLNPLTDLHQISHR